MWIPALWRFMSNALIVMGFYQETLLVLLPNFTAACHSSQEKQRW